MPAGRLCCGPHSLRCMAFAETLVRWQPRPIVGPLARIALRVLCINLPPEVRIGPGLELPHGSPGLVVHERTTIGARVRLHQGVTIGRSDTYLPPEDTRQGGGVVVEDGVLLGAGAVVMFRSGETVTVGRDAVIGANAVVISDVPAGEIWAGNPARRVGERQASHPEM